MAKLGETIARRARQRRAWLASLEAGTRVGEPLTAPEHLTETTAFGSNPGALRMLSHVPKHLARSPALVVVLHGCTQTAAGYDRGAGWSALADRHGFAVLLPEQTRANNMKRCFNWFQRGDIERDRGEPLSIRQMVERMIRDHGIDRRRVFVTGLSAGGAMACVMLATYPDVFSGGAIIAGLPYGSARNVSEAFESMFKGLSRSPRQWGDAVRAASQHRGPWPRISVWHGSADATVRSMNAAEIIKQWTDVHGLNLAPSGENIVDGYPHRVWRNAAGEPVIEAYEITDMAHGTPLATGDDDDPLGVAGPFLLEAGISSSAHIARFWGLTRDVVDQPKAVERHRAEVFGISRPKARNGGNGAPPPDDRAGADGAAAQPAPALPIDIGAVIGKALRAAGLMK